MNYNSALSHQTSRDTLQYNSWAVIVGTNLVRLHTVPLYDSPHDFWVFLFVYQLLYPFIARQYFSSIPLIHPKNSFTEQLQHRFSLADNCCRMCHTTLVHTHQWFIIPLTLPRHRQLHPHKIDGDLKRDRHYKATLEASTVPHSQLMQLFHSVKSVYFTLRTNGGVSTSLPSSSTQFAVMCRRFWPATRGLWPNSSTAVSVNFLCMRAIVFSSCWNEA